MKNDYIEVLEGTENELKEIKNWINANRNKFDSTVRYLIAYSVIKSSGSIEVVFKQIIYDFLAKEAEEKTANYLEKMILDSSCNPSTGNVSKMLQNISPKWKEEFDEKIKESGQKGKINSLVQLRNDFAHGANITVAIDTVITYYYSAKKMLEILDEVVH